MSDQIHLLSNKLYFFKENAIEAANLVNSTT